MPEITMEQLMEYEVAIGESFDIDIDSIESQGITAGPYNRRNQIIRICVSQVNCDHVVLKCNYAVSTQELNRDSSEHELTSRELEVARWLAIGKSNPEIALLLGISRWTAKLHVSNILRKLNVTSRSQIALALLERGLLPQNAASAAVAQNKFA